MEVSDFLLSKGEDQIPWRLFKPSSGNKKYAVLWIQGWTSSMDSHREGVKRMAETTGFTFATLDFAGHGLHKLPIEESTRQQQIDEVVAVYDELKGLGYENIIAIGGSFGGYLAALLTGEREVHTAVLRVPAIYDDTELRTPHKDTKRWQNPKAYYAHRENAKYIKDNKAVRSISDFDGFTYVIEHELDEQVPRVMPKTYFKAAKRGNYLIVPQAMHSPKLMPNSEIYFAYIEHLVISILQSVPLGDTIKSNVSA